MGGKKPKAPERSLTTQQIGKDPLSQQLAGALGGFIRPGQSGAEQALQQQGQAGLAGAQSAGGLTEAGTSQLRDTIAGKGFDALPGQVEALTAPALRQLQRSILPSISSEFAGGAGTGSGNEFAAKADAQEGIAAQIAAQAAALQNQERNRQFGAAQFFPQAQQGAIQAGQAQIQGGQTSLNQTSQLASLLPALRTTTSRGAGQQVQSGPGKGKGIGSLVGAGAGAFFGGPSGALLGSQLGGTAGSLGG